MFWRDFGGVTEGCRVGKGGLLIYKLVWMAVECLTAVSSEGTATLRSLTNTSLSVRILHSCHETHITDGL